MAAWMMRGYSRPWHFAGGWAIDLHLGRRRRWHKDVDLAVFRTDQRELRNFLMHRNPRRLYDGKFSGWRAGDFLSASEFQVFSQPWSSNELEWEFLIEDGTRDRWVYRRNPAIWLPGEKAYLRTKEGTPYLAPEIVLLFKAKSVAKETESVVEQLGRLNDEEDFSDALAGMDDCSKEWLFRSLESKRFASCKPVISEFHARAQR